MQRYLGIDMAGTLVLDTLQTGTGTNISTANIAKGIARAWVNLNGVGGAVVRSSFNVTSVVRNATGDYTINFTTPLADTSYAVVISTSGGATNGITGAVKASAYNGTLTNMTTSSLSVYTYNVNSNYDVTMLSIVIFGN